MAVLKHVSKNSTVHTVQQYRSTGSGTGTILKLYASAWKDGFAVSSYNVIGRIRILIIVNR